MGGIGTPFYDLRVELFHVFFRMRKKANERFDSWTQPDARGGILKVRGEHGGELMEEESWRRNPGGGIL